MARERVLPFLQMREQSSHSLLCAIEDVDLDGCIDPSGEEKELIRGQCDRVPIHADDWSMGVEQAPRGMVRRIQCERMGPFAKEVIEGLTTAMCYEGGISEHPLPSTDLKQPSLQQGGISRVTGVGGVRHVASR